MKLWDQATWRTIRVFNSGASLTKAGMITTAFWGALSFLVWNMAWKRWDLFGRNSPCFGVSDLVFALLFFCWTHQVFLLALFGNTVVSLDK